MKRALIFFILICTITILSKYYLSNYELEYKVNNYSIKTVYKNSRFYYEIDNKYNFDVYKNRTIKKSIISKIDKITGEDFECIYPTIKGMNTYPLCYKNDNLIDYTLIDSNLLDKYNNKKLNDPNEETSFNYYNTLDKNTYAALWNYKGYIIMNNSSYKNIELFNKDRYDNSLSYIKDNIIYMPDYNEEHEFTKLVTLDITNGKKSILELEYTLDYDSYIVGSVKNNIYIFDNKYSILYEINVKKSKTVIKSNNEKGYVKYKNGEFITCSKSEYKVNKIKYDTNDSIYTYKNKDYLLKTIKDNKSIKTIISNKEVSIIKEYQNTLYFIEDDYLYKYTPNNGSEKVLYFFELNFNKDNTIFIYNK